MRREIVGSPRILLLGRNGYYSAPLRLSASWSSLTITTGTVCATI